MKFGVCFADTFVVKMDNHSHYVSLTSSEKRAYKRKKRGRDSATRDFTKTDSVVECQFTSSIVILIESTSCVDVL